jgi:hypothetical protein
MILESLMAVGGLIVPPAFDFIKKKFLGAKNDTPEATLSTLATTKPEIIDKFVTATSELFKAKTMFFNRDVISTPSMWVVNLRASIRPVCVILFLGMRVSTWIWSFPVDEAFCGMMDMCITSWFGSRL